jgi:hypothetical protein
MAWTDQCRYAAIERINRVKEEKHKGKLQPALREVSKESDLPAKTLERWWYEENSPKTEEVPQTTQDHTENGTKQEDQEVTGTAPAESRPGPGRKPKYVKEEGPSPETAGADTKTEPLQEPVRKPPPPQIPDDIEVQDLKLYDIFDARIVAIKYIVIAGEVVGKNARRRSPDLATLINNQAELMGIPLYVKQERVKNQESSSYENWTIVDQIMKFTDELLHQKWEKEDEGDSPESEEE